MNITGTVQGSINTDGMGVRASPGYFFLPNSGTERPSELAWRQARDHPRHVKYEASAAARSVAMAWENPGHRVTGLSALALYGLKFFADSCDTTLAGPVRHRSEGAAFRPMIERRYACESWTLFYVDRPVPASTPANAVVEALKHLRAGVHSWPAPAWFSNPVLFRAISLIDASRRHLGILPSDIRAAARGKIDQKWLAKALKLSSDQADSPKETEMRLLCAILLSKPKLMSPDLRLYEPETHKFWAWVRSLKLELSEQVVVREGDRIITVLDLALADLKIGLMYDGEHHLDRRQRDRDARIRLELEAQGWIILRLSAQTLHLLPRYLAMALEIRLGAR